MTVPPPSPPPPVRRRWVRRLAQGLAGLCLGLVLAEGVFHLRDHGAFPHLNAYLPDDALGVRLRPGATQRLAFGGNPVTSVRINRDGFRGADLPPPGEGEIVVVGDSQVFGLGVEEHETASAELSRILGGRVVVNAGVPTYGPPEYNAVVGELLVARRPRTVIYVVNMVNDLFEAAHPNRERHSVWDGWAVRKETAPAPAEVTAFPGRALLFRESHLVLAARSFLHARGPEVDERGFASEPTVRDLVGQAAQAEDEHARAARETAARKAAHDAALDETGRRERDLDDAIIDLAAGTFNLNGQLAAVYRRSRDNPGDIVFKAKNVAEESSAPPRVASVLYNGAAVRREMEERIRTFAALVAELEANGVEKVSALPLAVAARWESVPWETQRQAESVAHGTSKQNGAWVGGKGTAHPLIRTFAEHEALMKRLAELQKNPAAAARTWSPLTPHLREVKALCDAHGARLLVVALPMDLQVSPAEWAKYDAAPVDMASTRILVEDVVASAEGIGAAGLDGTAALTAAEPGAFLRGDIHLTPKGHRALAEAIAAKLATLE